MSAEEIDVTGSAGTGTDAAAGAGAEGDTGGATEQAPSRRRRWIVLVVLGVLVTCAVGSCCALLPSGRLTGGTGEPGSGRTGWSLTGAVSDAVGSLDVIPGILDGSTDSLGNPRIREEDVDTSPEAVQGRIEIAADARMDVERMVAYFYPAFEAETYYAIDAASGSGASTFHIIARHRETPGFMITFFAQRTPADSPRGSDDPVIAYRDAESGVWWLHPQTRDRGLGRTFGPEAVLDGGEVEQIARSFAQAHPGSVVTQVTRASEERIVMRGIRTAELEDWYDDFTTFESSWRLDEGASPPRFTERDYAEE